MLIIRHAFFALNREGDGPAATVVQYPKYFFAWHTGERFTSRLQSIFKSVERKVTEKVTQEQLAKALGVSQSTVHRVLAGNKRVNPEARETILQAAEKMGYRVNFFASQLRSKHRKLIVLGVSYLQDPYCLDIAESFESVAAARGYRIMLSHFHDTTDSMMFHREILGPSGLNCLALVGGATSRVSDTTLNELVESGINVFLLGRSIENPRISQVLPNNVRGGELAADHFHALGVRKTWVLTIDDEQSGVRERAEAFVARARANNMPKPKMILVPPHLTIEDISEAARDIIKKEMRHRAFPEGIFSTGMIYSAVMLREANKRGFRPGKDYRIIGYDDIWPTRYFYPYLTTIRQPTLEMGRKGAEYLIDILEGKSEPGARQLFEPSLIVRES